VHNFIVPLRDATTHELLPGELSLTLALTLTLTLALALTLILTLALTLTLTLTLTLALALALALTHELLPGVHTGDIGPKIGYNTMDNGHASFDRVRIPRANMPCRY